MPSALHQDICRSVASELGQGDRDAARNEIHVSLPAGRQAAAAVGVLLQETDGLEVLEDVPDEATCAAGTGEQSNKSALHKISRC